MSSTEKEEFWKNKLGPSSLSTVTSVKQRMLLALLLSETVSHLTASELASHCRSVIFDYITNVASKGELQEAARNCSNVLYIENEVGTWASVCAIQTVIDSCGFCSNALKDIRIVVRNLVMAWNDEYPSEKKEKPELLFSKDGPVSPLIPDFNNIPSLEEMLLNYPKALELAKNFFNKIINP